MTAGPVTRKKASWQIRYLRVRHDSGKGTRTSRIPEFLQIQSFFALVSQCIAEFTLTEKFWTDYHEFTRPERGAKLIYLPSDQLLKKQILIIPYWLLLAVSFECCERREGTVEGRVHDTPVGDPESLHRLVEPGDGRHDVGLAVVVPRVVRLCAPVTELEDRHALGFVRHAVELTDHRPRRRVHAADQHFILDRGDQVGRTGEESREEGHQRVEAVDVDDRIVILVIVGIVRKQRLPVRGVDLDERASNLETFPAQPDQGTDPAAVLVRRRRVDQGFDFGQGVGRGQLGRAVEGWIDGAPVVRAESQDRFVEAGDIGHDVAFGVVVPPVVDLPAPATELDDRNALGFVGHAAEAADHRPGRRVHAAHQGLVLDRRDEVRRAAVEPPEELRQHIEAVNVDDRIVVLDVVSVVGQQRGPVHVLHLEHAAPDLQPILAELAQLVQSAGLRIVNNSKEHERASEQ
jgi:hypothetical protein